MCVCVCVCVCVFSFFSSCCTETIPNCDVKTEVRTKPLCLCTVYTPKQHVSNRKGLELCVSVVFYGVKKYKDICSFAIKYPEFNVNKITIKNK